MFLPTDITLQSGDSGDHVRELQVRLSQRELLGEANINSSYDGPTEQAVRGFQGAHGILTDGIAGPRTLRLLISIGTKADSSGGSSGEQEEEKAINEERHDDLALEEKLQEEKGQQQLADLDRYNDQHEQEMANEQAAVDQHDKQTATQQDALDHQRSAEHELEQLSVTQDGVEATTPMDELENKQLLQEKEPEQAQAAHREQPQPEQAVEQPHQATATEQQVNMHNFDFDSVPKQAPQAQRDPDLVRVEVQLDTNSQQVTQQEGQQLDSKGIANEGSVPITELGQLHPAQTPAVQREREIGLG